MPKKIYFGNGLFSEMEKMYNAYVVDAIKERYGDDVEIYLPQENEAINDKSGYADSITITDADNDYLFDADILVAIIDGPTIDNGLCSEIGAFFMLDRPILAIYSDSRQGTYGNKKKIEALDEIAESQFSYVNLYTVGQIKKRGKIVKGYEELVEELSNYV